MSNIASSVRLTSVAMGLVVVGGMAFAQEPARDMPQNGGAGIRSGNITATGETVPNPGASQGAGTTAMDKGIERQDNQIQTSICKGC